MIQLSLEMKPKMKTFLAIFAVQIMFNSLLAECSLIEKLQTRLREKFKGTFPYNVL